MVRFVDLRELDKTFPHLIRRKNLHRLVPLADTTIYQLEQNGQFPRRFQLTRRSVAWDLAEVEAWLLARRNGEAENTVPRAPIPDVRLRKARPVKRQ